MSGYNYQKLNARIIEKYESKDAFYKDLGISRSTYSMRCNGKVNWSQRDIQKVITLLNIPVNKIGEYFFTPKA